MSGIDRETRLIGSSIDRRVEQRPAAHVFVVFSDSALQFRGGPGKCSRIRRKEKRHTHQITHPVEPDPQLNTQLHLHPHLSPQLAHHKTPSLSSSGQITSSSACNAKASGVFSFEFELTSIFSCPPFERLATI